MENYVIEKDQFSTRKKLPSSGWLHRVVRESRNRNSNQILGEKLVPIGLYDIIKMDRLSTRFFAVIIRFVAAW